MDHLEETTNCWKPFTIFAKSFILEVWRNSEDVSMHLFISRYTFYSCSWKWFFFLYRKYHYGTRLWNQFWVFLAACTTSKVKKYGGDQWILYECIRHCEDTMFWNTSQALGFRTYINSSSTGKTMFKLNRNRVIHSVPLLSFYSPWKQKTRDFLIFFRGYKKTKMAWNR